MSNYGSILDRNTVKFERVLEGPIERVWDYLTKREHLAPWLGDGVLNAMGAKFALKQEGPKVRHPTGATISSRATHLARRLCLAVCSLVLTASCAAGVEAQLERSAATESAVGSIVQDIRRADYEGDRDRLVTLYDDLAPYIGAADAGLASRVHYWRGFAYWRRALNGFNDGVDPAVLEADLEIAIAAFEAAHEREPDFADATIGMVSCVANLIFLHRRDSARVQELVERLRPLSAAAAEVAPDNPRLLWVQGASAWRASPGSTAEREARGFALYHRGLELARARRAAAPDLPLDPTWGEAELLMNLAWANLNKEEPDPEAASRYAQQALVLVPYWHYVRDILVPQIEEARRS